MSQTLTIMNMLIEAVLVECRLLLCIFASLLSIVTDLIIDAVNDVLLGRDIAAVVIAAVIIVVIVGSLSGEDFHNQVRRNQLHTVYSQS